MTPSADNDHVIGHDHAVPAARCGDGTDGAFLAFRGATGSVVAVTDKDAGACMARLGPEEDRASGQASRLCPANSEDGRTDEARRCRSSRYNAIVMSSRWLRSRSRVSWAADVGSSIRRGRLRAASGTASGWLELRSGGAIGERRGCYPGLTGDVAEGDCRLQRPGMVSREPGETGTRQIGPASNWRASASGTSPLQ